MSRRVIRSLFGALSLAASVLLLDPAAHAQETGLSNSHSIPAIERIQEIAEAIRECWVPPPLDQAYRGMTMTVRFILKGSGAVMAEPRVTYVTEGAPQNNREAYRNSVIEAFARCSPFQLNAALRRTIVGRLLWLQIVDNRKIG